MTTALPAATTAVASTATQGDVKNWITGVHDYLAGLFGTTGVPADAVTALGVISGVSSITAGSGISVSGSTGAVTISSSALGYNTVGSYSMVGYYSSTVNVGNNYGGLVTQNMDAYGDQIPTGLSGTWKFMGACNNNLLFCRVA